MHKIQWEKEKELLVQRIDHLEHQIEDIQDTKKGYSKTTKLMLSSLSHSQITDTKYEDVRSTRDTHNVRESEYYNEDESKSNNKANLPDSSKINDFLNGLDESVCENKQKNELNTSRTLEWKKRIRERRRTVERDSVYKQMDNVSKTVNNRTSIAFRGLLSQNNSKYSFRRSKADQRNSTSAIPRRPISSTVRY